jgi:hypothetical protein
MTADLGSGTAASRPPLVLVHGNPENAAITGPVAERLAAGFDAELGRALLSLLRSAVQPVMAEAGAEIAVLEGAGHFWPEQDPGPAVEALTRFWAGLPSRA